MCLLGVVEIIVTWTVDRIHGDASITYLNNY